MSALPTGEYAIVGRSTQFLHSSSYRPLQVVIGRNVREDKSGLPKGVFTLDPSVGTEGGRRVSTSPSRHPLDFMLTVFGAVDYHEHWRPQIHVAGWRCACWRQGWSFVGVHQQRHRRRRRFRVDHRESPPGGRRLLHVSNAGRCKYYPEIR